MERREFVGSMLALFCATALPEPIVELIELETVDLWGTERFVSDELLEDDLNRMMKEIFTQPIMDQVVTSSQVMDLFKPLTAKDRYVDMQHYFELPSGIMVRDEGQALTVE